MFHTRPAYTPPIFVSRARFVGAGARVGSDGIVDAGFEASLVNGYPLAFVGEDAMKSNDAATPTTKILAGLYLAPFLLGPPAVGYLLLGTIGAVAGALYAAPAIYLAAAALKGT